MHCWLYKCLCLKITTNLQKPANVRLLREPLKPTAAIRCHLPLMTLVPLVRCVADENITVIAEIGSGHPQHARIVVETITALPSTYGLARGSGRWYLCSIVPWWYSSGGSIYFVMKYILLTPMAFLCKEFVKGHWGDHMVHDNNHNIAAATDSVTFTVLLLVPTAKGNCW